MSDGERIPLILCGKFIGTYSSRTVAETLPVAEYRNFRPGWGIEISPGTISFDWETGIVRHYAENGVVTTQISVEKITAAP